MEELYFGFTIDFTKNVLYPRQTFSCIKERGKGPGTMKPTCSRHIFVVCYAIKIFGQTQEFLFHFIKHFVTIMEKYSLHTTFL